MTEVEVGLASVVEDIHLAVLEGTHGARVHVDIGIELLHFHPQSAGFEQHADRSARESLAERAHDAAGHKDVLGHAYQFLPEWLPRGVAKWPLPRTSTGRPLGLNQ